MVNKQQKNHAKNAIMIHNDTTNQIIATECFSRLGLTEV